MKKYLALEDDTGEVRTFDSVELVRQLVAADFPGTAPIKYAFRNLAKAVREMRDAQNEYFKAPHGPDKQTALSRAKAAEGKVDKIIKRAHEIELLP